MKQKNLILIAVAVGCGLVAAFLTANMSAGGRKVKVDTVEIPSAAKDMPIGTKLKKEEIAQYVVMKTVPRDQVPPNTLDSMEKLQDMRLTRTLRQGDTFNVNDVSLTGYLDPPPFHSAMAIRADISDMVAGFVMPGCKVDVIASVQLKKSQKWLVFPLFVDMLVLAVDNTSTQTPNGQAFNALNMVTFAVNDTQSLLLQAAVSGGAQLRCALRRTEKPTVYADAPTTEQIWDILSGRYEDKAKDPLPMPPMIEKVKVAVPTEDLPAGTELSESILASKFKETEMPVEFVPENVIRDLKPHQGKYLAKDITAGIFLPKSSITDKYRGKGSVGPTDPASPKTGPSEDPEKPVPVVKTPEPPAKPKPVYYDVTVRTAQGTKKFRYQKVGEDYIPMGEVPLNAQNSTDQKPTKPEETKKEEPKAEEPKKTEPAVEQPKAEPEAKPEPKAAPKPEPKKPAAKPEPMPEPKVPEVGES